MANARRIEQVNILLREVLAEILERELQFPEGVLVTVTRVVVSEDLYYARACISVLGGAGNQELAVLAAISRAIGTIQHLVNQKMRMRPVPRLTFEIDQEEKRRERIEELLASDKPPKD